jgi:nucleotidyltransferase/DNA polymerase involved in DNA repair
MKINPELRGRAIGVCHSNSKNGTAEVASCNYEARKFGVQNGMFVRKAKELCPDILIVPYQFDKYEEVSHFSLFLTPPYHRFPNKYTKYLSNSLVWSKQ